jgi:hypothetical protein
MSFSNFVTRSDHRRLAATLYEQKPPIEIEYLRPDRSFAAGPLPAAVVYGHAQSTPSACYWEIPVQPT